ncbi:hypothetical protein KBC86_04390 [Candidatus Gracilibacteria bacterium]|nr:hypothetical protein [Candidatus Gracilibacteria bacterium]
MSLLARLEQLRLRTHFKHIVLKLKLSDTSHLSHSQKKNREHQIKVLESYGKNGVFPKNTNHPGEMVPYFRDTYSTLCAVGYLMWESGEKELVNTIVDSNNHIRVMEISGGPAREWMEKNGLSQEECAEIQPSYTHYISSIDYCTISDVFQTFSRNAHWVFIIVTLIAINIFYYTRLRGKIYTLSEIAILILSPILILISLGVVIYALFKTKDSWGAAVELFYNPMHTYINECILNVGSRLDNLIQYNLYIIIIMLIISWVIMHNKYRAKFIENN